MFFMLFSNIKISSFVKVCTVSTCRYILQANGINPCLNGILLDLYLHQVILLFNISFQWKNILMQPYCRASGAQRGCLKCSIGGTSNQIRNRFYESVHLQLFTVKYKFAYRQLFNIKYKSIQLQLFDVKFLFSEEHIFLQAEENGCLWTRVPSFGFSTQPGK